MRPMTLAGMTLALLTLVPTREAPAARPTTRCCVMLANDDGSERPWCFELRVRPRRHARRICRLVGGHVAPRE